jgi:hypothetical protein
VTGQLGSVERVLLARQLQRLETALGPGFDPLNWTSLGVNDFVFSCNKACGARCGRTRCWPSASNPQPEKRITNLVLERKLQPGFSIHGVRTWLRVCLSAKPV